MFFIEFIKKTIGYSIYNTSIFIPIHKNKKKIQVMSIKLLGGLDFFTFILLSIIVTNKEVRPTIRLKRLTNPVVTATMIVCLELKPELFSPSSST